ncbi:hypothetical protein HYS72_02350 [Candidatus Pacearchaeota archaeon]|nr:hypothetical protein [Candidatus Pacearchaeota archaeon]MBI2057170.1 hypothetical protein [Candidatus Pacearchaeota archaeon]
MGEIKNLEIWIIALLVLVVLIFGINKILGVVVNPFAFIVSLAIIILILILVIIFSQQNHRKKIPRFEPKIETLEKDASEKKLKVSKDKMVKKVSKKK